MKRMIVTAVLLVGAWPAFSQAPAKPAPAVQAPSHKCEPKPEFPGRLGMTVESRRKQFERDLKNYQECMTSFVEERKAIMKAHETAGQAAIEEYNAHMKKLRDEQDAAKN